MANPALFRPIAFGLALSAMAAGPARAAINLSLSYTSSGVSVAGQPYAIERHLRIVIEGREVLVYDEQSNLIASRSSGRFAVAYGNGKIDFTVGYPSFVTYTRISTDGKSSCHASLSARLKPGRRTYLSVYGEATSLRFSRVSCQLSTS